jgi:hypothetical protein
VKKGQKQNTESAPKLASEADDLQEDIANLRDLIRQVTEEANKGRPLAELLQIVDVVGCASVRRANLLKAQKEIDSSRDLVEALNTALAEITAQLHP